MSVLTITCSGTDSMMAFDFADYEDAFDHIDTTIRMARQISRQFPSLLPKLRDQVLLNFARWLTDGEFSESARHCFIQLCARRERSTAITDVRMITAFGVADALTEALTDPNCWPDFDARLAELKTLMMASESC